MITPKSIFKFALVCLALFIILPAHAQLLQYKPGREYRSLNTASYEISIQKNGRLDIALASGAPVFLNVFPMIQKAKDKEPKAIRLDGRYSQRFEVNDALGRGQGMRIRYKDVQWTLRAYPTKPYLAVQLAYINSSKKPVQIKQLVPWAIGDPKKGSIALGANTIDSKILIDGMSKRDQPIATREGQAPNMIAILNPQTNRSLIAGFTTQVRAFNDLHIRADDPSEPDHFNYMRAINTYDPPVTVQPNEVLESEILYLAINESDPLLALERYAKAVAVTNKIPVYKDALPISINVQFSPTDGWRSREIFAEKIEKLSAINIPPRDIQIVLSSIDLFNPHNLELLSRHTAEFKARGFKVGLKSNPFAFRFRQEIVVEHPDWFLDKNYTELFNSSSHFLVYIDVTNPDAMEWFEKRLRLIQDETQFESLWGVDLYPYTKSLKPNKYYQENEPIEQAPSPATFSGLTQIEVARLAMESLRNALGKRFPIVLLPTNEIPLFPYTQQLGRPPHLTKSFLTPHLGYHHSPYYQTDRVMSLTKALLRGNNLLFTENMIDEMENSIFLPPLLRPAKPQDLFFNDDPSIWLKRGTTNGGHWILAGIDNNTDASRTTTLPINNPSIRNQPRFTLFDLQQERYYGLSQTRININVSPQHMRTLLLREYRDRPLYVGSTFPIAQSLPDRINEHWDPDTLTLTGSITTSHESGTLHFVIPQNLTLAERSADNSVESAMVMDYGINSEKQLELKILTKPNEPTNWSLVFTMD